MATLPTPRTWTVGELLTAAKLNADLRDGLNFLLRPPLCILELNHSQSIPYNNDTIINLDYERVDTDNGHSTTTNPERYVVQTAGWYEIIGRVGYDFNATGGRSAIIYVNTTDWMRATVGAPDNIYCQAVVMGHWMCNVNDYIRLGANHTISSGGPLSTGGGIAATPTLQIRWVGRN
jgi:hypothetical protein